MDKAQLISFEEKNTGKGSLTMFQDGSGLPFSIGKVLTIQGMKQTDVRGQHAHHKTQEIVVALQGGCEIEINDGTTKEMFVIDNPNTALYIPPQVWRTLTNFQPHTILLLIANLPHEPSETDYIRDYDEFKRLVG